MARRTILFLVDRTRRAGRGSASHHWLAAEVGFRSIAADWRTVRLAGDHLTIGAGYDILGRGRRRRLPRGERVRPDVILHRKPIGRRCERLLADLARAFPHALHSYDPALRRLCLKWPSEEAFRSGAGQGLVVPRPSTYLVEKAALAEALAEAGHQRPLIFKPSGGVQCRGVRISTPDTFDRTVEAVRRSWWTKYVVQDLSCDPMLYRGHKFDLRVFALVSSFDPVDVRVYREGVARLAARAFDPSRPTDARRALTGASYRKRIGAQVVNVSITRLLRRLAAAGYDVHDFWPRLEHTVRTALTCLARDAQVRDAALGRRFLLTGVDVLMTSRGDSYELLFLEANYLPQLNGWGRVVDRRLRPVHRQWLLDLARRSSGADA